MYARVEDRLVSQSSVYAVLSPMFQCIRLMVCLWLASMNLKASPEHLNSPLIECEAWKRPSALVAMPLRVNVVSDKTLESAYFRMLAFEIFRFGKIKRSVGCLVLEEWIKTPVLALSFCVLVNAIRGKCSWQ